MHTQDGPPLSFVIRAFWSEAHCVGAAWLNNCVGFNDHRYVFLFMFFLWLACFYLAIFYYPLFYAVCVS
jgi:hypothetical protein